MKKKNYRNSWRKLDNTAKIFSLSVDDDMSVFRFSILLKEKVDNNMIINIDKIIFIQNMSKKITYSQVTINILF